MAIWSAIVSFCLCFNYSIIWIYPINVAINTAIAIVHYLFGLDFYDNDQQTQLYYTYMATVAQNQYGKGIDLGFNFYDGDYTKSKEQSQLDKFEYAFKLLRLEPGMSVVDVGCGFGDWLVWLRDRKRCRVLGINLTEAHCEIVRKRGVECINANWKDLLNDSDFLSKHKHQFDCVTYWDTIEHYVKQKGMYYEKRGDSFLKYDLFNTNRHSTKMFKRSDTPATVYTNIFELAKLLINPNSSCKTVWSSTLHQNRRVKGFYEVFQCFIIDKNYNGAYPFLRDGLSKYSGDFKLVHEEDRIEDYRQTSIRNCDHFGNYRMSFNLKSICCYLIFLICDPYFYLKILDKLQPHSSWMWHVGGIGEKIDSKCITSLLWQVYEL
jgi:SAM-dependent methyltransferase